MKINGEIENLLANMVLKTYLNKHRSKKTPFHASLIWNGLNKL